MEGCPNFEEFLNFLGDKIELKGWNGFRGGLDNESIFFFLVQIKYSDDSTGKYSIYTTISGFEIMFHVSTLLPHFPNDKQQVERKR